jgi:hypothetical protein
VSQGLSHEDLKVQHFTPAQERSANMQNGDSPSSCLSQSEDDYEQKGSVVSVVASDVDKQEMLAQSEDKSDGRDDDVGRTDVSCLLSNVSGIHWHYLLCFASNCLNDFFGRAMKHLVVGGFYEFYLVISVSKFVSYLKVRFNLASVMHRVQVDHHGVCMLKGSSLFLRLSASFAFIYVKVIADQ